MQSTTIDIHPHIISPDAIRYPLAPLGGHQSDWSRTRPVTLEQLVAAMDTAGVQKAAIVQASTCYGHDNSYVADAVSAYPKRFTGVFSVDVLAPDAPEHMHRWRAKGLTGMRLFTFGSTMSEQADWLDDPKSYPAWACASELGLSICLQMSAKAIPQAIRMAERFPKVRIILDHCARPDLADGPPYNAAASLFALARYSNVYLKLTPRIFAECRPGLDLCQDRAGALPGARGLRRESVTSTVEKTRLYTLLGDYPNTMALKKGETTSSLVDFDFADVKVSNTAFKPLVREARFDVGELAIVTYLQARAYGKPFVLIPATVLGRGQHHTIAYNPQRGPLSASGLAGKRVGVRAYTQTTGAWVRGFLSDDYGVDCA